eukprot:NODE_17498_length_939_cov_6.931034.p1 GENE.NODE_17498_length_939_cov_6.931034~~NODE_17498_length_939_cov_6.931034.p1  ORF type:complete len:230 (+),score=69.84 NODE_17498_length_939_cov_6.931034:58-690(+)
MAKCGKSKPRAVTHARKKELMKIHGDPSLGHNRIRRYEIVGRGAPSTKFPHPVIYRLVVNARSQVRAKSRFWYFMKKLNKVKATGGECLACTRIFEKNYDKVKNYGIWLRYESRTNTHNMYKEFRDMSMSGAMHQLESEMTGTHRAQTSSIQILGASELGSKSMIRREHVREFAQKGIKFPIINRIPLQPQRYRTTFVSRRPLLLKPVEH